MLQPVVQFPEAWLALVNKRSDWHDFIDNSEESEILCSELPIGGSNDAHFSHCSEAKMLCTSSVKS